MSLGAYTTFTTDRFGNLNSALSLNGDYTQVNSGYFFDTDQFTISAWVYPDQLGTWSRVMDFGQASDTIFLSLAGFSPAVPVFGIWNSGSLVFNLSSATPLINKNWQFLTATFQNMEAKIYVNGVVNGSFMSNDLPSRIFRLNNYFGKSNFNNDGYSNSYLDDLRFYNVSLSQSQVIELMVSQDPSKQTFYLLVEIVLKI